MRNTYLTAGRLTLALSVLLIQPIAAQSTRLDPGFQLPRIMRGTSIGTVYDILRQPDGRYVIGGSFSSINGVRVRNLARLHADGTLDVAFSATSQANGPVYSLALQPDGRILAGGQFDSLAGVSRPLIGRLTPTGGTDTGFAPNLTAPADLTQPNATYSVKLVLLPTGNVLVRGYFALPGQGAASYQLVRLGGGTGALDAGFQASATGVSFAVQPDGSIVLGGATPSYMQGTLLRRIQPSGAADPSFQPTTTYYTSSISHLLPLADGSLYAGGLFNSVGTHPIVNKLLPNGGFNVSFRYGGLLNSVTALAEQPTSYLLVAGRLAAGAGSPLTERVRASNGQLDAGYIAANGPRLENNGDQVRQLLVQPDGAIMMAGTFSRAGTTPVYSLVRMLDDNAPALATRNQLAERGTMAWPVPAREMLHVQVAVAARPQQVQLLDMLGRAVLSQPVTGPQLSLRTTALPAGSYLLRVVYATGGAVLRRVVLE